jgi:hypothetical protein
MVSKKFNEVVEEQLEICKMVLCKKADEYATVDRLHNFKVAAALGSGDPIKALSGMMAKHTVSIYDMCGTDENYPIELWNEKITDHINYLLLLKGLLIEQRDLIAPEFMKKEFHIPKHHVSLVNNDAKHGFEVTPSEEELHIAEEEDSKIVSFNFRSEKYLSETIDGLKELLANLGYVTVADLYIMQNITFKPGQMERGWVNLDDIVVEWVEGVRCWKLVMPPVEKLTNLRNGNFHIQVAESPKLPKDLRSITEQEDLGIGKWKKKTFPKFDPVLLKKQLDTLRKSKKDIESCKESLNAFYGITKTAHTPDPVSFHSSEELNAVLHKMTEKLENARYLTVGEVYDIVGRPQCPADYQYGWSIDTTFMTSYDTDAEGITKQWRLILPEAQLISKIITNLI